MPDISFQRPERTFASLAADERARLAGVLRPLPWIDGLIAAAVIAPEDPEDWLDHIWVDGGLATLTVARARELTSLVEDQYVQVANQLLDDEASYRPFLGDQSDELTAASEWVAGFRFGIRLLPEPWRPLIEDDDTRTLLAVIFCLERDESLPEAERAESPFSDIPATTRDDMRRRALSVLAHVIPALNAASIELDAAWSDSVPELPYVRATPKVGRNEPCPCGSGKKYKKCCLARDEQDEWRGHHISGSGLPVPT
jgi:uncharacterized protein